MTSILTSKFSKTEEKSGVITEIVKDDETQKKNRASKLNPLLNSKTDEYVDDHDLYKPRITRAERLKYWIQLQTNKKPRKLPNFISWISKEVADDNELNNYSKRYIIMFAIIKSSLWDHLYINLFIVWWLIIVFYYDGWAMKYVPIAVTLNANNTILILPPLFMFISQLIPVFGTIYFITNCNDLVRFLAITEIGRWGFACVLLSQYFEYFLYSGQGLSHRAGNCKKGSPNSNTAIMVYNFFSRRIHKNPKILVEEDNNSEGVNRMEEDQEEEEDSSIADNEQGQSIKANDNNNSNTKNNNDNNNQPNDQEVTETNEDKDDEEEEEDGTTEESNSIPYIDWQCMVCLTNNHELSKIPQDAHISFGEKGILYKRIYAKINLKRIVPHCKKCYADYDYIPPKGTAHLFPNNKNPYVAFQNYPIVSEVQAGLKIDQVSVYKYKIQSFFYGIRDVSKSLLLRNDWKLRKWVNNRFPELPRYILGPEETYQLGEIVECRQQKFDWCRARVFKIHTNNTYDLRYDANDEIRFVQPRLIRTIPEKRAYAFRVELGVVIMVVLTPLGAMLSVTTNNYGLLLLGIMIVMIVLFLIRLITFFQYFYNYYDAGFYVIARLSMIYTIPLFFIMLSCILAVTGGNQPNTWIIVSIFLIFGLFSSLLPLYMLRPPYALIGLIIFLQITIGLILITSYINKFIVFSYVAIPLAPFLTTALFIKFIRSYLYTIWDVSLIMHPKKDTSGENPSIFKILWDLLLDCYDG